MAESKRFFAKAEQVNADHGLVLGHAIVCKEHGEPYFDVQGDHIPEDAMLAAAADFMQNGAMAKEMHDGEAIGSVLFAFPMTTDIAKALGIQVEKTGLLIAMKPDSEETLEKFRDGTFTGFSIGGQRVDDEEVDDDA